MKSPGITRWGGMALMLGASMFMLTKTRGYVDPDDSLLGYFMLAGFSLWLLGLAALYARYAPFSGGLGKTGLGMSIVGIVLLAVGHPFSFMTESDLFVLVILGTIALTLGPLLFGLAAWRTLMFGPDAAQSEILPRRWRAVPLFTGLMGLAWFFNTGETTFFVFRTLFAVGWLLMGYVLFSDARQAAGKLAPQEI